MLTRSCETLPVLSDQNHLARLALLLKYWLCKEAVVFGATQVVPPEPRIQPNRVRVKLTVGLEVLSLEQPVPTAPMAAPELAPVFWQTQGPEPTSIPSAIVSSASPESLAVVLRQLLVTLG